MSDVKLLNSEMLTKILLYKRKKTECLFHGRYCGARLNKF